MSKCKDNEQSRLFGFGVPTIPIHTKVKPQEVIKNTGWSLDAETRTLTIYDHTSYMAHSLSFASTGPVDGRIIMGPGGKGINMRLKCGHCSQQSIIFVTEERCAKL